MTLVRALHALCLVWLTLFSGPAQSVPLQPVPALTGHVVDTTGTLDASQKAALEAKLAALERDKGAQVVLLLVGTTAPEDLAAYANRVGNSWKLGRKDVGDGLIVLTAVQDHRVRIEVAKTLEGAVPDLAAKHIIDEVMVPAYRTGNYVGGLDAAVDRLGALVRGEALPPVQTTTRVASGAPLGGFDWMQAVVLLFIAVPVVGAVARGLFGRKLGALLTGAGVGTLAYVVTASVMVAVAAGVIALLVAVFSGALSAVPRSVPGSRGRSGGLGPHLPPFGGGGWSNGGGGFGGGGFSSGGGGDFGGGGASGNW